MLILLSESSKGDRLDGTIIPVDGFCRSIHETDHAVLQFGHIDGLLVILGLEDDFSLALEGGMLHFLHRLDHQLEKFLLILLKGG